MVLPHIWDGLRYVNVITGNVYETFVSGVTMPRYVVNADFTGERNVGCNPQVPLTTYTGPIVDGIATLSTATVYENILFPCVLDIRNAVTLRNCRIVVPKSYTFADSIKACVRILNGGAATTNVVFEGVEIHNRAQRPMNAITGRNATIERMVISGCIDGFSDSDVGSAPLNWGFHILDSIVCSQAFWYSPTINPDVHGSTKDQHSDSIQKTTGLEITVENTALINYVDDFIGTGTPGSGNNAGNTYVPASGYNYIASQAQMEAWREEFAGYWADPAYTIDGLTHRQAPYTSMASVMFNSDNITLDHCYFAGGNVQINASDTTLPTSINAHLIDNTFWNDMTSGPGSRNSQSGVLPYEMHNQLLKGYAILVKSGKSFQTFTNNKWSDGTNVAITELP